MATLVVLSSAFMAALLTLFSGFGLGTLLMPVMAIFFPLTMAIAMTAVVHLMNNLFKFFLLSKYIVWKVILKFGLPALFAAIPGAWLLSKISHLPPLYTYQWFHLVATMTPVKLIVGILLIGFATMEWRRNLNFTFFKSKYLPLGGLLSGFFGGISGQQGAFRTPFLLHLGLTKREFVSTNAAIAVLVDISRLFVYGATLHPMILLKADTSLILLATLMAFLGSILGVIALKKVTLVWIQRLVALLLYLLGLFLLLGII